MLKIVAVSCQKLNVGRHRSREKVVIMKKSEEKYRFKAQGNFCLKVVINPAGSSTGEIMVAMRGAGHLTSPTRRKCLL